MLTSDEVFRKLCAVHQDLATTITVLMHLDRLTSYPDGKSLLDHTLLEKIMATAAELQAAVDDLNAAADTVIASQNTMVTRVTTDVTTLRQSVTDLNTQLAALQAQVAAGGAPQSVMDAIAAIKAKLAPVPAINDGLDPTVPAVIPTT